MHCKSRQENSSALQLDENKYNDTDTARKLSLSMSGKETEELARHMQGLPIELLNAASNEQLMELKSMLGDDGAITVGCTKQLELSIRQRGGSQQDTDAHIRISLDPTAHIRRKN